MPRIIPQDPRKEAEAPISETNTGLDGGPPRSEGGGAADGRRCRADGGEIPSDGSAGANGTADRDVEARGGDGDGGTPPPAPPGNDYAVGNSGGGAPPQNQNAAKHHLHSDPCNVLETLWRENPDGYRWVMAKYDYYLSEAPFTEESSPALADQLRQIATREYAIWQASGLQISEGVVKKTHERLSDGELVEMEAEHSANLPLDRMERTVTRRLKELGVLPVDDTDSASRDGLESEAYRIVDVTDKDN